MRSGVGAAAELWVVGNVSVVSVRQLQMGDNFRLIHTIPSDDSPLLDTWQFLVSSLCVTEDKCCVFLTEVVCRYVGGASPAHLKLGV